ncbi:endo-1,4-beta-xylanase [Arthrobacter sp. KNU-44]|uniref:endo-1,4-beta-xylanase n=1 Tax=unclassified Arthrobacter TaxID=235627 RepID=UPI003F41F68E
MLPVNRIDHHEIKNSSHEQSPTWVNDGRPAQKEESEQHYHCIDPEVWMSNAEANIYNVQPKFKGKLDSLDVVNEPFDVDQGTSFQQNIWYRVFGPGYPAVVSKAVHDADPDVKQFINENGADVPGPRQDALLKLALDTNALGGHIYGVGLQAHVYDLKTDAIPQGELSKTLATFEAAGLHVRISENDVTDGQGTGAQAEQYATVLATCLRSPACVSYTTWGVDNRYDWFIDNDGKLQQGHDLLFNNGQPTPAYDAMRRALGG